MEPPKNDIDILVDEATGQVELVEISSDEQAVAFRKEIVIPYFKDIFKVRQSLTGKESC
jgi:hypothetical protein